MPAAGNALRTRAVLSTRFAETKAATIAIAEDGLATLEAFERAWGAVSFHRERMARAAVAGYTVATDVADALIAKGVTARAAHALVGAAVAQAEAEGRALDAPI